MKNKSAYSKAGIDIDSKLAALRSVKKMVKSTMIPGQICEIGSFGGMFSSPGRDMALIASTDGVGTKLKVAVLAGKHDTVGQDLVNHCVNDILVHGAKPMFFLDYFAMAKFEGRIFKQVVSGICRACRENHCALLGGETAEMPGLYPKGEYDLVGTIVGAVEKKKIITGKNIRPGDAILGLPSSGLHTNGYSLARKIIFEREGLKPADILPGTGKSVSQILLAVHRSYLRPVSALMKKVEIQGMAHITGGGFPDNVPRVLPADVDAVFDLSSWTPPSVFSYLQKHGRVARDEMYRVFNMGIGLVIMVRSAAASPALKILRQAGEKPLQIGRIEKGSGLVRLN
jgi:phosphoribosylformylglycinamidine cyclo-ligase